MFGTLRHRSPRGGVGGRRLKRRCWCRPAVSTCWLLVLEPLALELQRLPVLGHDAHHVLGHAVRDLRLDLEGDADAGADEPREMGDDLLGDAAGVTEITVQLEKGFFRREMVQTLTKLDVRFDLEAPDWDWVRRWLSPARRSRKAPLALDANQYALRRTPAFGRGAAPDEERSV